MQTLVNNIEQLIQAMTLAEKLGQLTMTASGYTVFPKSVRPSLR